MRLILIGLILTLSQGVFAANVITNPASTADNVITASVSNIPALTINGSAGTAHGALEVYNSNDWDAIQGISSNGAGVYAHGDNFAGLYAESSAGVAGIFTTNSANNTSDYVQVLNLSGSALMSVDSSGMLKASSGLQLPSSGSCDASHRGTMKVVYGGAGVADLFQVCLKAAAGTYSWVTK